MPRQSWALLKSIHARAAMHFHRLFLLALLWLWSASAAAHAMQVPYNLPVPLWLYAYGATAALLASFVVVGYFVRGDTGSLQSRSFELSRGGFGAALMRPGWISACRVLSVLALLLTIAAGLAGTKVPTRNFNITFFWVVFVLGFTYLTALIGDVYRAINPLLVICDWLERLRPGLLRGKWHYPQWLGYYPALALYMGFIWIELFGHTSPRTLSLVLLSYVAMNLAAAWMLGRETWFRQGELFAVLLRLVAKLSPLEYRCAENGQPPAIRLRLPFVGLLSERADHFSLLVFVLFMLSSTAYDGLHETVPWVQVFWKEVFPVLAKFIAAGSPGQYLILVDYFYYWQWLMMLVSPFVYLAIYLSFVAMAKLVARTTISVPELALQFALSLVPIAFVYNVTHYFTLALAQGPLVLSLAFDPFGFGWNLLGNKGWNIQPILLDAGLIWHTQVALILFGHILSVYLAHVEALKVFATRRQAALSQLPMLVLMVMLTTIGLWILSLPIAAGQVLLPTGR